MRIHALMSTVIIMALLATTCGAETLAELKASMDKLAEGFHGTLGYSLIVPGKPGQSISRLGDEVFPTASTIKTAIMVEVVHQVEQGKIKWSDAVEVQQGTDDRQEGGFAYYFRDGTKLSIDQWVHLMITVSDNTATMLLREHIGQRNVNDWLESHGFKQTKLLNGKKCDELGLRSLQRQYGLGMTTPNEMARLIGMIRDGKAGSPASCDRMMRLLGHQYWDDGIAGQVPPGHCFNKTGAIDGCRSDAAVVSSPKGEYILVIYTKDQTDRSWNFANEGSAAIRTLAAMVWRHFDPAKTWSPPTATNLLAD
jgi:beta-lactamase class A